MTMDTAGPDNADRAARLARLSGLLLRRIREQSVSGLSISQDWIMALLAESPGGLSSAELARAQGVRAQTMSTAVLGLQKAGFVSGAPDGADGRRTILHATDEGIQALDASREAKERWLEQALEDFGSAELAQLDTGLDMLERIAKDPRGEPR